MSKFHVQNPDYVQTVMDSFGNQGLLPTLGAELVDIQPGVVTLKLPFSPRVTQQNGFIHGGALTSIADTACGYAALTLMPPKSDALSIEYKINFLAPARGVMAVAIGQVVKPGGTITVCQANVYMVNLDNVERLTATMQATMLRRGKL